METEGERMKKREKSMCDGWNSSDSHICDFDEINKNLILWWLFYFIIWVNSNEIEFVLCVNLIIMLISAAWMHNENKQKICFSANAVVLVVVAFVCVSVMK